MSNTFPLHPPIANLRDAVIDRDRVIAMAYVRSGESRRFAAQYSREHGVALRTVYRAIDRQIEWAREQMSPGSESPCDGAASPSPTLAPAGS